MASDSKAPRVSVAFFNKKKIHDLAQIDKTHAGIYNRVEYLNISNMPKQQNLRFGVFSNLRRLEATDADLTYFLQYPEEGSKRLTHIILKNTTVSGDNLLAVIRNALGSLKVLDMDAKTLENLKFRKKADELEFNKYISQWRIPLPVPVQSHHPASPETIPTQLPYEAMPKGPEFDVLNEAEMSSRSELVYPSKAMPKGPGFDVLNEAEMSSRSELVYPSARIKNKLIPSVAKSYDLSRYLNDAGSLYKAETKQNYFIQPLEEGVSAELQGHNHEPLITVLETHTHVCGDLIVCPMDPEIKAQMILTAMGLTLENPHADFDQTLSFDPQTQGDVLQKAILECFAALKLEYAATHSDNTDDDADSEDSDGFGVKWDR